ncbi:MAG UNVERIFIED_CONTAM: PLDc N-terminal domain-containing protein [Planctomycetaceae bacterium]|jgi:cardiolipin synthase
MFSGFPDFWPIASPLLLVLEWGIRLTMLFWVPVRRSPDSARSWLLLIFFEPLAGLLLYGLFGRADMPRARRRRIRQLNNRLAPLASQILQRPEIHEPRLDAAALPAARLASRVGTLPILEGNSIELMADYHRSLARLTADIESSVSHVHLLYYIFGCDSATQPILDCAASGTGSRRKVPHSRGRLRLPHPVAGAGGCASPRGHRNS